MPQSTKTRITLGDIAADLGLSGAAVSMALRGNPRVSQETRLRVVEAAERLGYVYDRGAATLRTGQSDTVGIVVGDISNPFFGELVLGVDEALGETGKISYLLNAREDPERQDRLLTRLREQGVDGIILCAAPGTDTALVERVTQWGIPLVQMLRFVDDNIGDCVSADYQMGVEALVEHLVRLGHSRIAFIGGELDHSATWQRLNGFRTAMERHRLATDLIVRTPLTRQSGRQVLHELLALDQRPTAAICYNDIVAFGVIAGVREAGLEPGRDFAVTGFDNVEEAAESWPPLTTVATHPHEIGIEAGRRLLKRIQVPDLDNERIILPTRIILRRSCGRFAPEERNTEE